MKLAVFNLEIVNYDDLEYGAAAIIEAALILGLPDYLIDLWVVFYLKKNVKIKLSVKEIRKCGEQ
jgi:hypothetical protein